MSLRYTATVIELAILGLLKEGPLHGYELRRRLREDLGIFGNLSFGSLYPALARLEDAGAVRVVSGGPATPAPTIPLTGSLTGERAALRARLGTTLGPVTLPAFAGRGTRSRKVYEITPRGEEIFAELLGADEALDDARSFAVRLAFARHLTPAARLRLLERRRQQLAERLANLRRHAAAPDRLDRYERSLVEHAGELTSLDLGWVERLIDAERAVPSPPQEPVPSATSAVARSAP
jgi:DNA-binding PadR family transcriptional regulator